MSENRQCLSPTCDGSQSKRTDFKCTLSAFISQASIEGQYGKVKAIRSVMVF